jgi:hypothetical protein
MLNFCPLYALPLFQMPIVRGVWLAQKKDMYIDTLAPNYIGDCMAAHSLALVAHKKTKVVFHCPVCVTRLLK